MGAARNLAARGCKFVSSAQSVRALLQAIKDLTVERLIPQLSIERLVIAVLSKAPPSSM